MCWFAFFAVFFFIHKIYIRRRKQWCFEAHAMSFPCTELLLLLNYAKVNTVFHSMAPLNQLWLYSSERRKLFTPRMAKGCVNHGVIFIFEWTIPLKTWALKHPQDPGPLTVIFLFTASADRPAIHRLNQTALKFHRANWKSFTGKWPISAVSWCWICIFKGTFWEELREPFPWKKIWVSGKDVDGERHSFTSSSWSSPK